MAAPDDWSNKDDDGLEAIVNLHVGSRYRGTKELRELMSSAIQHCTMLI